MTSTGVECRPAVLVLGRLWAKSFRMDSDYPRQKNLEVHFNDRNAIQLDLTWSSETGSSTEFKPKNIVTDSFTYLSPLIVWKYRF